MLVTVIVKVCTAEVIINASYIIVIILAITILIQVTGVFYFMSSAGCLQIYEFLNSGCFVAYCLNNWAVHKAVMDQQELHLSCSLIIDQIGAENCWEGRAAIFGQSQFVSFQIIKIEKKIHM